MKYYFYVENNKINSKGQAKCLNLTCVEVTQEIYNDYEQDKYIYENGEIVLNPQFEEIKAQARKDEFNNAFFKTSLGYIRREVSMLVGTTKTFLTDMLPQLVVGFPILAYEEPDFTKEVNVLDYQKQVIVTEEFLKECKDQLIIDFYGFNPME